MNEMDQVVRQTAVVAALVKRHPGLGRTALMKYVYLLQTVKGLPLGFDFTLYSYGPYDGAVLSRLSTAVHWNAVKEIPVMYSAGTGYDLQPGVELDSIVQRESEFFEVYSPDLDWVVNEFKNYTAAGMELIGTMVFADREAKDSGEAKTKSELVDVVLRIKPRFSTEQADEIYNKLKEMGVLVAVEG